MTFTDYPSAPADPQRVVLDGLALGLRAQADRMRRCGTADPHGALGAIAEATVALDLLKTLVLGVFVDDDDQPTDGPGETGHVGAYL